VADLYGLSRVLAAVMRTSKVYDARDPNCQCCSPFKSVWKKYGTYTVQKLMKVYTTVVAGFWVATGNKSAQEFASWNMDTCLVLSVFDLLRWITLGMVHMLWTLL
jgi:hypothetical protein